jgi:ribosome-binding protein aMBF1 (putative translation factor)
MDTCYQCGRATDAVFRAVGADGSVVVVCIDCAVRGAILAERERDPGAVAAGDQLVASVTRPGDVVVTASELLACRTVDEVDALVERKEAEARLLDELEP